MFIPAQSVWLNSLFSVFSTANDNAYCPIDLPNTCTNTTAIPDSCCFEYPGGIFLQSQFWNYRPSKAGLNESEIVRELGPLDSFTIHGLWPDNCDGSFDQFCRRDLFIDDVYYRFHNGHYAGTEDLYDDMDLLWKSNVVGGDESLWIHEYNKHGSCIKNLYSECYERWGQQDELSTTDPTLLKERGVIDYFNASVNLFKKLDTYKTLEGKGIVPSTEVTYSKSEIEAALTESFEGKDVFINCNQNNELTEIWYYHRLQGSLLNEHFKPMSVYELGKKVPFSRCKATGIKYFPKGHAPRNGRPGRPGNGGNRRGGKRGVLRIFDNSDKAIGFVIKNGHWMTKGTPANYQLIKAPFGNYNLKSRLGYCAFDVNDELACHYKNPQDAAQFDYNEETGRIGYSNVFDWGANEVPQSTKQGKLYIVKGGANDQYKYKLDLKFISM